VRTRDLQRSLVGRQAIAETSVDRRLGGVEGRQRLAAFVHVVQLAPHHRRQQSTAAMRAQDADPCHAAAPECASGNGHFVGKDASRGHDFGAVENRQAPVELRDLTAGRQLLVRRRRRTKGAPNVRRVRTLFFRLELPELEAGVRA